MCEAGFLNLYTEGGGCLDHTASDGDGSKYDCGI